MTIISKNDHDFSTKANEDVFLDDNIEMAKLFRKLNIAHELVIIDTGACHPFLNLRFACDENKIAYDRVVSILQNIIETV